MQDETRDELDRKRKISDPDETEYAAVEALSIADEEPKARKRKKPKERMSWGQCCEDLEDWEFRRTYRMARPTFD